MSILDAGTSVPMTVKGALGNATSGMMLLSALLDTDSTALFLGSGIKEEWLSEDELEVFEFVSAHLMKHGQLPHMDTVEESLGISLPIPKEPPEFYLDRVTNRFLSNSLVEGLTAAQNHITTNPQKVLDDLTSMCLELGMRVRSNMVLDYRDAEDRLMKEMVKAQLQGDEYGIRMGWPTLDEMSGGLVAGDVVSYVGRPAMGKTSMLLYSAYHVWKVQKKVPLFITMEMIPMLIEQRLAAIDASINPKLLKTGEITSYKKAKLLKALKESSQEAQPFYVVDGNLAVSIKDIWQMVRRLKPDVVFVDGAYLLRHPNKRLSKFDRVTETAEGLKWDIATNLNIPVVASYQLNREAAKETKKGGGGAANVGLENIGYSDAIGQLSSIVLALFEAESAGTELRRKVTVMKGRSGESGSFLINWDYDKMDFLEIAQEKK